MKLATGFALALGLMAATPALAAGGATEYEKRTWSFSGPFGTFDRAQLQRGFKVYKEVCASCHSMDLVSIRTLGEPGGPEFSEAAVKAIAKEYTIMTLDADGEEAEREGKPSDRFPAPFANELAARASNSGAYPPDFSVLAKARAGGPDYIAGVLMGYTDPPADMELREGMSYNTAFPGHQIAMAQPIDEGSVTYDDGTPETLENYSEDVSAFLMWAAEPKMEARKRLGFQVMIFLVIFAGMLYFSKHKLWKDVDH